MRRQIVFITLAIAAGCLYAQVDTAWVRHHQFSNSYSSQTMSPTRTMAVDADGNLYVGCYGQYSRGDYDYIVLKYSPAGTLLWSVAYDGGGRTAGYLSAIATDAQCAVYATGYEVNAPSGTGYSIVTVKWDASGNLVWAKRLAGDIVSNNNAGRSIATGPGGVYIVGQLTNSATGQDFALAKLDQATGATVWVRQISPFAGVGTDDGRDIVMTAGGYLYVCGLTYGGATTGTDAAVAKYDTAGNQVWLRSYNRLGGSTYEVFYRMAVGNGVVAAVGTAAVATYDFLTVQYDTTGSFQWVGIYNAPGNGTDQALDVHYDASGYVYVCGQARGTTGYDLGLVKYAPTGTLQWSRLQNLGTAYDAAFSLDIDSLGNAALAGGVSSGSSPGYLYVVKYAADGTIGWGYGFTPPGSGGVNYGCNVLCVGGATYVSGLTHWGFPQYTDPTLLKVVEVPDVTAELILAPTGALSLGIPVAPQVRVRNNSLLVATFPCRFTVSDGYLAETTLTLGPAGVDTVVFPNWTPTLTGNWIAKCSTRAVFDYNRDNDSTYVTVRVTGPAVDVGLRSISSPAWVFPYQTVVVPTATWHNFGTGPATLRAWLFIDKSGVRVYSADKLISALPANGLDTVIQFPAWIATQVGQFTVKCSTSLDGDGYAANDTMSHGFGVINEPTGEWVQMRDMPSGSAGRPVYQGGRLAGDEQFLYALKGNKTNEVARYDIAANTWQSLPELPFDSTQPRKVAKGGAITTHNGLVYAARGNKTREFFRYDSIAGWTRVSDIPLGIDLKPLRGGTGMTFAVTGDTGFVYLLKGNSKDEFFRYNTVRDSWQALHNAPAGTSAKAKYADGSGLCSQGDSILFCLKAKYNEVFRFDVRTSQWLPGQLNIPIPGGGGANKKVKVGGSIAWGDEMLTALKGGNCSEFWRLVGADSSWREYASVPGGTLGKRVKDGAGLFYTGGYYYALKGNKTLELWRFRPNVAGDGAAAGTPAAPIGGSTVDVFPNPINGVAYARLVGGGALGPVRFRLYDAGGRLAWSESVARGSQQVCLPGNRLKPGVFFLVVDGSVATAHSKLTVVR